LRFWFGNYVLDPVRRELLRGGEPIVVEPKVFDLLVYLVENRERVVTKDNLVADVWSGRIVSDSALTSAINGARKAIGDSGQEQLLVRTIARKGFRFVGRVNVSSESEGGVRAMPGSDTLDRAASSATSPKPAFGLLKVFSRSNDFLSTGDEYQLPSILLSARQDAWFVGTTFYISIGQYRDLFLSRLADGIDINFLILNPESDALRYMALLLGVTEKELLLDCMSGIRVMDRTLEDSRNRKTTGSLTIKLIDEPFQTRFYLIDPKTDAGYVYLVPQVNGINSQTVPGFLLRSSSEYCSRYLHGIEERWNRPSAKTLDAWKRVTPTYP
jgi:DNA-binding winged helix-turn-helix (wHTH) protein